ncbi:hypothetical protein GCK32_002459 [Trichostrongylus colubriformis]|uniref:DUF3677 domain-containing protein n=1 Tax=Trichostrongylus colubriformis TaxID=6319 RepID=A0AAN8IE36_TRICO
MIPLKPKVKTKGLMKSVPSGVLAPKSLATKPVKPLQKAVFAATSSSSSIGASAGLSVTSGARPPLDESWREFCEMTTVDFATYATSVQEAIEQSKMNKLARLLAAAFRTFIDKKSDQNKFNIEYQLLTTAALTIKEHHEKIQHVALQKCLLNLMCRMKPMTPERQGLISALAVTLASGQPTWDPYYVTVYLHDSLGDRIWVSKPSSSFIATHIVKGFGTIYPTKEMFAACNLEMDLDFIPEGLALASDRFPSAAAKEEIAAIALSALAPWWEMRADTTPALFLRAIAPLMALPEVRFNVVKRIDGWLQHVKLQRLALQLLILVGLNYGNASDSPQEKSVLARLLQMRMLKNKNVTSVFTVSLREMLVRKSDCNIRTAIRLLLENEFGHVMSRHPHNVSILISMFGFDRTRAAEVLGEEISEMIMAREEYCKPVRLLLREIIRFFHRNEFPFYTLANSYLSTIVDEVAKSEHGIQDHVFRCASELLSAVTLMSISASVREAFNARRTGANYTPDLVLVHDRFENALSEYMEGIVRWLQGVRHIFPSAREYLQAYHRLLFMDRPEVYCALEQGPTEAEYLTCFKVICECRLKETVLRMILGDHITMLDNQEAIRLIEGLTKRAVENRVAADAHLPLITLSNPVQLIDRLFQLSGYRWQPGVALPDEFNGFATRKYYWKAWYIVMMWACAGKVGIEMEKIYSTYPQLRLFIHMVLVKSFRFPLEFEGKTPEEWEAVETDTAEKEKEAILAMESFLSKCSVDEESSKLIGTVCFNQPRGMPRRPPEPVIRKLEVLAVDCGMASRLCECRQPDMVDQLIRNVGPSKAMPAIQELFATNSTAIEAMPASTLCQYLHYDLQRRKVAKIDEGSAVNMIVARVRAAFADASVQDDCVSAVLFLLDKRIAFNVRERLGAKLVLTVLFTDPAEMTDSDQAVEGVWMRGLQSSPFYPKIASSIVTQLARAALDSEDVQLDLLLSAIHSQMSKENMHQLSILLAVLVENFGKTSPSKAHPLLDLFVRYVELCAEAPEAWPTDFALSSGRKAVVQYCVEMAGRKMFMTSDAVEALLKLLCYTSSLQGSAYRKLAEVWLPENNPMPLVSCDGEQVDLLTSKLRAFMLQFDHEKIVKIATENLDPALALKVACEMSAMRPEHASQLLKIACETRPLTRADVMSLDKTARIMLNIHNINGIQHAQQVLNLLDEIQSSCEEKMEVNTFYSSPPRKATEIIEPPPAKPMTRAEMIQHLKAATVPNAPFVLGWNIWRATQRAEDVAMAVVEHLEGNLKFFLGDREAFNLIFAVLGPCAKKFPSVKRRLSTFSAKVLKSAATSPAIEGHLRQYVPNAPAPSGQKKKDLTEEEMLEALHTRVIPVGYSRALLLNKFLKRRVEIFKRSSDPAEFDAQMMAIFGDYGIEELVAQMPLRSPLKTIETVFLKLLSSFNAKYNPKIVCSFFMLNAIREFCRVWTAQQWACLARYVVEMVMGDPQQMKAAVGLIDRLVDLTNVEVAVPIAEVIITLARSDLPIEKRKHAQSLLDDIQLKYPCLFVDPLANQASIQGFRWRQRDTDGLVTTLVAQAVDPTHSDALGAVRTLTQMVETYPQVMIRNFGSMAQQIPLLTRMSPALRKEIMPFVAFVLDATQKLLPSMRETSYRYVLGDAVHAFLSFYETISNSEAAAYFGEKLLACCMKFLGSHTETAREVFSDRSDVIHGLLQKLPPSNLNVQMMTQELQEPDMEVT